MTEPGTTLSRLLPANLAESTFVGRDHLISHIATLVTSREHRLFTLTGPGGVGKTRLATEVVRTVGASFGERIAFVRLGPVRNAALFGAALDEALGLGQAIQEDPLDRSIRLLSSGRWLLVIDNFEHLLDAAPYLERVLVACPETVVIVTSRVVPGLANEHLLRVPSLSNAGSANGKDDSDPISLPGVRLYTDRARMAVPGFRLTRDNAGDIASLCNKLGGLPLAIQLAASRTALFSPQDLLRLDGSLLAAMETVDGAGDHRHASMRNAITWSFELLTPEARDTLTQLSVLEGDFPFAIAEALTGCSWRQLGELVDHHFLDPMDGADGERRFSLHEMIRQFGQEHLRDSGSLDATRHRMATVLHDRVDAFLTSQFDPDFDDHLNAIELDMPVIRSALSWSLEHDHVSLAARVFCGMEQYWVRRSRSIEARFWMKQVLEHLEAGPREINEGLRGETYRVAGRILTQAGDFQRSRLYLEKAIACAETTADGIAIANAMTCTASLANQVWDLEAAQRLLETALQLVPLHSNTILSEAVHSGLGVNALFGERFPVAERHLTQALRIARDIGEASSISGDLHYLGYALAFSGDHVRARKCTEEALALHDPKPSINRSWLVQARAWVELLAGNPWGAAPYLAETLQMRHQLRETRILHLTLHDSARAMLMAGKTTASAWTLGAGDARSVLAEPDTLFSRPTIDTYNATLAALGEQEFQRHYNAGAAASEADAVQTALAELERLASATNVAPDRFGLTARERDVLALIARGHSDFEIAATLYISRDTAKTHARNILRKLGVSSRLAAVTVARREKVVTMDE